MSEAKIRAAYGQSGNEPLFGQKFTPLSAIENIAGLPGLVVPVQGTVGSKNLHPERQREFEAGKDLGLAGGGAGGGLTFFYKKNFSLFFTVELTHTSGFGFSNL